MLSEKWPLRSGMIIGVVASITFCCPESGHAYLDPGAGSFIFQMLAAALLGVVFSIKLYWRKIMNIFKKKNKADDGET
jgi:hypothetical protein